METNKQTNKSTGNFVKGANILTDVLDAVKDGIHQNNVKRGFYDQEPSVCEQIALIMTEGAEAIEADRKNRHADIKTFNEEFLKLDPEDPEHKDKFKKLFETYIKDTVEDELADIFIRLMDYCGWKDIDIAKHIVLKVQFNLTRPYRHGKQY